MSHTILLVQPSQRPETRTYSDYESVNECMEGVCKIYEEHLKRRNPNTPTITYDISQLFDFVDQVKKKGFLFYFTNKLITSNVFFFSWLTLAVSFTKNLLTPMHHTTKNGSKRRFTYYCDRQPVIQTKTVRNTGKMFTRLLNTLRTSASLIF